MNDRGTCNAVQTDREKEGWVNVPVYQLEIRNIVTVLSNKYARY